MILVVLPDEEKRALFTRIYEKHTATLVNYALSFLGARAKAESAVQECFVRMHNHMDQLENRSEAEIKHLLMTTTKRICFLMLREPALTNSDNIAEPRIDSGALDAIETKLILLELLPRLSESKRQILIFRLVYDLPFGQIAKEMGISEKDAAQKFHRARAALKVMFTERVHGKKITQ